LYLAGVFGRSARAAGGKNAPQAHVAELRSRFPQGAGFATRGATVKKLHRTRLETTIILFLRTLLPQSDG
jgi:hypothetical protein